MKKFLTYLLVAVVFFNCGLTVMPVQAEEGVVVARTTYAFEDGCYNSYPTWTDINRLSVSMTMNNNENYSRLFFLKFDLADVKAQIAKGCSIKSAKVKLRTKDTADFSGKTYQPRLSLYAHDDNWTEAVNENDTAVNPPVPVGKDVAAALSVGYDPDDLDKDYVEIPNYSDATLVSLDITEHLKQVAQKSDDNYLSLEGSYRFLSQSGTTYNFYSKESGTETNRPQLYIEYYSPGEGIDFTADELYLQRKAFNSVPKTFEASFLLPQTLTEAGGVILGNYKADSEAFINLEINENGNPCIRYGSGATPATATFSEVDAATGGFVNIAVTLDASSETAKCYVNGALKQTIENVAIPSNVLTNMMSVGGDSREGNTGYFKGFLSDLRLYSDVRTDEEINTDFSAEAPAVDGLLGAYKPVSEQDMPIPTVLEDNSANGVDFYIEREWIYDGFPIDDYAYSFAVVGDTQKLAANHPHLMTEIYDYIIETKDEFNTKFVFGLGDITNNDTAHEYVVAKLCIDNLRPHIPFSVIAGNHDGYIDGVNNAPVNFKKYFSYDEYKDTISGSLDGTMLNTYHKFNVGNIKYLAVNLDYLEDDATILKSASDLVAAHPDYNVIVTTHGFLNDNAGVAGRMTYVDEMWNDFIKKHSNVVMVLCGHEDWEDTDKKGIIMETVEQGENGNVIREIMINPQNVDNKYGGAGIVAMLHFSEDGKKVQLRYYSTVKEAYYKTVNQYEFDLNVIESTTPAQEPKITTSGITFNVNLSGNVAGKLIAALYDENNNFISCKTYNAQATVPVSFDSYSAGAKLKIFWWNGETITPITLPQKIEVSLQQ